MPRILHLGIGNFHRAHQAAYTQAANAVGPEIWEIVGVSLRSPQVRDVLKSQNNVYTLAISGNDGTSYQEISCIRDVLFAPEDQISVISQIADPKTRIVSLTVTEKGYHLNPSSGRLDTSAEPLRDDLDGTCETIYGLLAKGLRQRLDVNAVPITILSCDNLNANGSKLQAALGTFIDATDPKLASYVEASVAFPNCMVDRITPATTDSLITEVERHKGHPDKAPVATEAYSEWVIEDDFPAGRPAWESTGAVFTKDVEPFELRKLRLLNGAHSGLAYAGVLAGHRYVHEAISDPDLRMLATGIMAEAAETLPPDIRETGGSYSRALIDRFANRHLNHELRQIAMDGSLKLPIRLVATWHERTARGLASPAIEQAISAWIGFAIAETVAGRALQDPASGEIADLVESAKVPLEASRFLLQMVGIAPDQTQETGLLDRVSSILS